MTILLLIFSLEMGLSNPLNFHDLDNYTQLEVGFEIYELVFIRSHLKTYQMLAHTGYSFNPFQANYLFEIGCYPVEWLEIGFRHYCNHPIISSRTYTPAAESVLDRGEELYFKISGEIILWEE